MENHEGQIVGGLFKITKKDFSKGGQGEIHLAQDSQGRKVVLKFPLQGGIVKDLEEFKREYQNLLKFSHPNVARVYQFGEHEGSFFIASEFIEGDQFYQAVKGLTPEQMLALFMQALEGLEAIHTEEMLHLDIKSANILVTKEGKVKIIDFGIAIARSEFKKERMCGSATYMAPEMILKKGVDNRADLFSFGCLMYKCVAAGRYPFPLRGHVTDTKRLQELALKEEIPKPPSDFGMNIPPYLDEIILKLLGQEPQTRFGSARAVINALRTHSPDDYKETPEAKGSYLIPQGNRHIGREKEQGLLRHSLEELLSGKQPTKACFWIYGAEGMGKSHFLNKIKEAGEKEAEKIFIHHLELPRGLNEKSEEGNEWLKEWIAFLDKHLADNEKPLLVLVDNVAGDNLKNTLQGLMELLHKRAKEETLFAGSMPIMLCVTSRSKPNPRSSQIEIELKPFTIEEVKNYLKATPALKNKEIPTEWAEALLYQSDGSPKELKEILIQKDSKGLLFDLNGEIVLAHVEDNSIDVEDKEEVPQTSQKRLTGLLGDLSDLERECLQWMAVWCHGSLLSSIQSKDLSVLIKRNHLLPALNQLVAKGLILRDGEDERYSFGKYSYLPGWIYQNLDDEELKKRHQAIYEHIKGNGGDAALLHIAFGNSGKEGIRAGLHLGKKYLYEQGRAAFVKKIYERISQRLGDNFKSHLFFAAKQIEACYYAGDYEEAKKIFQKAKEIVEQKGLFSKTLKTLLSLAVIPAFLETLKLEEGAKIIEESLKFFDGTKSDPLECILLNFKARLFYKKFYSERGDMNKLLGEAKACYDKSEVLEQSLHPVQKDLIRNNDLGIVLQTLGDQQGAAKKLCAKLERLKRNPNIFVEFVTLITLADANRYLKNYEDAAHFAGMALKKAQETKQGKWIQYAHQVMACIHQAKGSALTFREKDRAKKEFEEALKENSCSFAAGACLENRQDAEASNISIFIRKGQCYQELSEWDLAVAHFEAALHYKPTEIFLALSYLGLGECHAQKGENSKARDYLNKCLECLKTLPAYLANNCEFNVCKALARCSLKEKNLGEAGKYIAKMKTLAGIDQELLEQFQFFEKESSASYAMVGQNG